MYFSHSTSRLSTLSGEEMLHLHHLLKKKNHFQTYWNFKKWNKVKWKIASSYLIAKLVTVSDRWKLNSKNQNNNHDKLKNKTKQNKKFKYEAHFLLDSTSAEREDVLENSKSHVMTNGLDLRQMTVTMTTTMTMTTTTTTMTFLSRELA